MSRKHDDQDPTKSARFPGSPERDRYRCIACDRPRSSTYHLRHPPEEPPPPQGVCRRCIQREQSKEHPPPAIMIYEVHHYHHACACANERPFASPPVELPQYPAYPQRAELPAEEKNTLSMNQLFESAPPPVKFGVKPSYWKR